MFRRFHRVALLVALAVACSSTRHGRSGGAGLVLGPATTDLPTLAAEMVESLLSAPELGYLAGRGDDRRLVVLAGPVENRTREPVDAEAILERVRGALLESGRFRFEDDRSSKTGLLLSGTLYPLADGGDDRGDCQLVLECRTLGTGELIWRKEEDLRRTDRGGIFERTREKPESPRSPGPTGRLEPAQPKQGLTG